MLYPGNSARAGSAMPRALATTSPSACSPGGVSADFTSRGGCHARAFAPFAPLEGSDSSVHCISQQGHCLWRREGKGREGKSHVRQLLSFCFVSLRGSRGWWRVRDTCSFALCLRLAAPHCPSVWPSGDTALLLTTHTPIGAEEPNARADKWLEGR